MCFVGLKGCLPGVDIHFCTYEQMICYLNENLSKYKDNIKLTFYVLETDTMYCVSIKENTYTIKNM